MYTLMHNLCRHDHILLGQKLRYLMDKSAPASAAQEKAIRVTSFFEECTHMDINR